METVLLRSLSQLRYVRACLAYQQRDYDTIVTLASLAAYQPRVLSPMLSDPSHAGAGVADEKERERRRGVRRQQVPLAYLGGLISLISLISYLSVSLSLSLSVYIIYNSFSLVLLCYVTIIIIIIIIYMYICIYIGWACYQTRRYSLALTRLQLCLLYSGPAPSSTQTPNDHGNYAASALTVVGCVYAALNRLLGLL